MIGLTMCLFGGFWTLVIWVMKAMECFKHCIKGHNNRNMEDSGAKGDLNG